MSSRGRRHSTLPLPGEGGNPAPDTWPPLTPRIGRGSLYLLGRVESSCFPNSSWTSQIVLASQIVHPTNIMMGGLCYNWVTVKALTLLWHNPRRKDSGVRQYCWVGMEFQAPHMSSTDIRGMEQPLGVKVLAPHFAFSDTTPVVLLIPPPPISREGRKATDWVQSPLANDKNQSCLPTSWNLHKNPKWHSSESFQVYEHTEVLEGWCTQRVHRSSALLPPYSALYTSSIWLSLSCMLCNKVVSINKVFSWVSWALLENYWPWEGGSGSPPFIAGQSGVQEAQAYNWHL